jgi:hypothetical protein
MEQIEKNKKYIYESPDGGKTIYRREFGNYEKKEKLSNVGFIEISEDYFVSSHDVEWIYNE